MRTANCAAFVAVTFVSPSSVAGQSTQSPTAPETDISIEEESTPTPSPTPIRRNRIKAPTPPARGREHAVLFQGDGLDDEDAARADLKDVGVLTFLAPGIRQQCHQAKPVGDGIYEINFVPPQSGVYYIFSRHPSLGVAYRQIPHLILNAEAASQ